MEDEKILDLYFARDERAIRETEARYDGKLNALALRIVAIREDAQECVNDTYLTAWQTIPPQRPEYFFAYLAKICRNFCLGRLDWLGAAKRKANVVTLTRELELCIPDSRQERHLEGKVLGEVLNRFLGGLSRDSRMIFLRRYWFADSVADIAQRYGMSQSKVKTSLHRTRNKLEAFLEKEGVAL